MTGTDPERPGRWGSLAGRLLRESDDLFAGVAGLTARQGSCLRRAGVGTMTELALLPGKTQVPGLRRDTLARLRAQAKIRTASLKAQARNPDAPPKWKALPLNAKFVARRLLPPRTDEDTFFDLEGDPFVQREYLWGYASYDDAGAIGFKALWAHDAASERWAFAACVDEFAARWDRSRARVYHYGAYELTALRRVASEAGDAAREALVDRLDREGAFVDLYKVVKRNLILGEPRYSLKNIEKLYRAGRAGMGDAASSVVGYEAWLASCDQAILDSIEAYNKDDCVSTAELAHWLRDAFQEDQAPLPPPPPLPLLQQGDDLTDDDDSFEASSESDDGAPAEDPIIEARRTLIDHLLADGALYREDRAARSKRTLSGWLEYHFREQLPVFRQRREWLETPPTELADDERCVGFARRRGAGAKAVDSPRARSLVYEYAFKAPQPTRLGVGARVTVRDDEGPLGHFDPERKPPSATIVAMDVIAGVLKVKCATEPPRRASFIPDDFVNPAPLPAAVVESVHGLLRQEPRDDDDDDDDDDDKNKEDAARSPLADFASRAPPRLRGMDRGEPIVAHFFSGGGDDVVVDAAIAAIKAMDGTTMATYLAARAITALMGEARTVGVVAGSHATIAHALLAAAEAAEAQGIKLRALKLGAASPRAGGGGWDGGDEARLRAAGVELKARMDKKLVAEVRERAARGEGQVVGATAWGFANAATRGNNNKTKNTAMKKPLFDYVFVDEAGQFPAANLAAVAGCAANVVLLGDQMQLPAPTRGAHPADASMSCLEYLLGHHQCIPPALGIFLAETRRLHPKLCGAISELVYDGRLVPHPSAAARTVPGARPADLVQADAGLVVIDVRDTASGEDDDDDDDHHSRVATMNRREAAVVARVVAELLESRTVLVIDGSEPRRRPLTPSDILVVAPYNAHVRLVDAAIRARAVDGVRVGTVDRFQGREAPVVIASLCVAPSGAGYDDDDDADPDGDPASSSRQVAFVLDIRRLNVALSRAQSLAVLVAAPTLADAHATTLDRMRQVAMLARLRELAVDHHDADVFKLEETRPSSSS